jgi:diketogulonate reductase-like aldo/keto reductase
LHVHQQNHKEVGEGLAAAGVPRSEIFVTTKLWCTHLRPDAARAMLERILADLGLDYVDQLLIHWPVAFAHSEEELHPQVTGRFLR